MLTPSLNMLAPLLHGATAERIFTSDHQLKLMVRFEVALACALESAGMAPAGTGAACHESAAGFPAVAQQQAIAAGAAGSGNLAIPFVKLLTAHVRERAGSAADFIHFGATSQDALDTALVLSLAELIPVLDRQVNDLIASLISLTEAHHDTLLAGRTWMQQGPPVPFALKTAQWLSAMLRHRERIAQVARRVLVLQFGGAVGTLASLGTKGVQVAQELAGRLHLANPDLPWHSQRDNVAEFAATLALLDGTLGKIARDLSLMVQTEVSEVVLAGSGGSSTMPHKRNPVALAVTLSAAIRAPGLVSTMLAAMVQEHERGLGGWHAEWETLPELCRITEGSLAAMTGIIASLELDPTAMERNLRQQHGVAMAEAISMQLSPFTGRPAAHAILEQATHRAYERSEDLFTILCSDPLVTKHLPPEAIRAALDPASYLGSSSHYVEQVLKTARHAIPEETPDAIG